MEQSSSRLEDVFSGSGANCYRSAEKPCNNVSRPHTSSTSRYKNSKQVSNNHNQVSFRLRCKHKNFHFNKKTTWASFGPSLLFSCIILLASVHAAPCISTPTAEGTVARATKEMSATPPSRKENHETLAFGRSLGSPLPMRYWAVLRKKKPQNQSNTCAYADHAATAAAAAAAVLSAKRHVEHCYPLSGSRKIRLGLSLLVPPYGQDVQ